MQPSGSRRRTRQPWRSNSQVEVGSRSVCHKAIIRSQETRCDTNAALPPSVPSATLAVPPLASLTVATDATPEPPNGPRSARGVQNLETGASSRVDEIDTSASRPESRNRFPQQINESLDHARNQMRKAWTRLRKGKREEGGSVV